LKFCNNLAGSHVGVFPGRHHGIVDGHQDRFRACSETRATCTVDYQAGLHSLAFVGQILVAIPLRRDNKLRYRRELSSNDIEQSDLPCGRCIGKQHDEKLPLDIVPVQRAILCKAVPTVWRNAIPHREMPATLQQVFVKLASLAQVQVGLNVAGCATYDIGGVCGVCGGVFGGLSADAPPGCPRSKAGNF